MAEKKENNIVVNSSKAYGYNYASLGDIAMQGFKIPKMKTGTDNNKDYVYYYDTELNEWVRGAEIVIPEMKGSNSAQRYGASITYARRVTAIMCLGLATAEDCELETKAPTSVFDEPVGLKTLADEFRSVCPADEQARILKGLNISKAEEMGEKFLNQYIQFYKQKR